MKVAACYSLEDVVVEERPIPELGPGDLLVRVEVCGLCGSDLSKLTSVHSAKAQILGHEMTGTVIDLGRDVDKFEIGQRVVAGHHAPCFDCHYCRHANYSMCAAFKSSNLDPGGFAEFVRIPELNVKHVTYQVPTELSYEEGSFTEPLACCVRALRRSRMRPGDVALVLGLGSIGLLILQLFRVFQWVASGADLLPERLQMAQSLGADLVGSPKDFDFLDELRNRTEGRGPDLVITATDSPHALRQALELVRNGGTVNLFGGLRESQVELDMGDAYKREITLMASYSSSPDEFPYALELLRTRQVRVSEMVTHRFPLEGLAQAIAGMLNNEGFKSIVLPHANPNSK